MSACLVACLCAKTLKCPLICDKLHVWSCGCHAAQRAGFSRWQQPVSALGFDAGRSWLLTAMPTVCSVLKQTLRQLSRIANVICTAAFTLPHQKHILRLDALPHSVGSEAARVVCRGEESLALGVPPVSVWTFRSFLVPTTSNIAAMCRYSDTYARHNRGVRILGSPNFQRP